MGRWTLIATLLHYNNTIINTCCWESSKTWWHRAIWVIWLAEESNVATPEEVPYLIGIQCPSHACPLHMYLQALCIYIHYCLCCGQNERGWGMLIRVILARVCVRVFLPRGALFTSYFISTTASSMLWTLQMSSISAWGEGDRGRGRERRR